MVGLANDERCFIHNLDVHTLWLEKISKNVFE